MPVASITIQLAQMTSQLRDVHPVCCLFANLCLYNVRHYFYYKWLSFEVVVHLKYLTSMYSCKKFLNVIPSSLGFLTIGIIKKTLV